MSVDRYLSIPVAQLEQQGAYWTAREISQQPQIWQQVATEHAQRHQAALAQFLQPLLAQPYLRIILTGAGTSAYIGQALAAHLQQQLQPGQSIEAIATTDLVSNPKLYLHSKRPTLLVSYGRSGNSPESVAAVDLAEQLLPDCHHLVITCNAAGKLATFSALHPNRCYLYALPDATHDQSFAMTSSFSSMYLATLLSFAPEPQATHQLIQAASHLLEHDLAAIRQQAETPCQRMVFLGSGPLQAIAREAGLKYLELTAGQILSHYESPLGFRHGPKSLVNDQTQILLLPSADSYTSRYDLDLLAELQRDHIALRLDSLSSLQQQASTLPDAWLGLLYMVWCQTLACYKALQLGISPDNPCPGGQVNRVVQGVTLYPLER